MAKLLQNKTHEEDKLNLIKDLQKEFPDNKDIIRYHAIFLIQTQMSKEIDFSQKSKQQSFKEKMKEDLKLISRNH